MVEESFAKRAAKQRDTAILRSLLVCGASRTDRRARVPESPRRLSVAGYFGETLLRLSAAESEPSRGGEARSRLHAFGTRLASRWTLRANHRSFLDSSSHVSTRQFAGGDKARQSRTGGVVGGEHGSSKTCACNGHRESHRGRTTPSICASPSVEYGSHAAIISKVSSRCGMER